MLGFARWLCALAESRDAAGDSFQLGLRAAVALLALVAWPMPAAGQEPSLSKFREYLDQSPLRARLEGQRVGFRASLEAQIAGLASQVKE